MYTVETNIDELETLKIYYNGIKTNKLNVLKPILYKLNADKTIILDFQYEGSKPVGFTSWSSNNCYLDLAVITRENPLYKYFFNAYIKRLIHDNKYAYKDAVKRAENHKSNKIFWSKQANEYLEAIARLEQENPPRNTQPTANDIKLYKEYVRKLVAKINAEEKRIEDEKEAQRVIAFHKQCSYRKYLQELNLKYPIKDNDPYHVVIEWSEHPALEDGEKMSLRAANKFLGYLDKMENSESNNHCYDKTKFIIMNNTHEMVYTGRYDLGDGDEYNGEYGLIPHIYNYACHYKNHPTPTCTEEDAMAMIAFAKELWEIVNE